MKKIILIVLVILLFVGFVFWWNSKKIKSTNSDLSKQIDEELKKYVPVNISEKPKEQTEEQKVTSGRG